MINSADNELGQTLMDGSDAQEKQLTQKTKEQHLQIDENAPDITPQRPEQAPANTDISNSENSRETTATDISIFLAGAIGGAGSVGMKLISQDEIVEEIEEEESTAIALEIETPVTDWLPSVMLLGGAPMEFVVYSIISFFLGGISGFVLVSVGGISTSLDNGRRCLASAMLFGLFLPSSIQLMQQNIDSKIKLETKQTQVNELQETEKRLSTQNSNLAQTGSETVEALTKTDDVKKNLDQKRAILESNIEFFKNANDVEQQREFLNNIAGVGLNNVANAEYVTLVQSSLEFLDSVVNNNDDKYDPLLQAAAKLQADELRAKCTEEQMTCKN